MNDFFLDWLSYLRGSRELTLVTASDDSHAKSLLQLVQSAKLTNPYSRIVVFDLGICEPSLKQIQQSAPYCEFRRFEYELYPDWFNIKINAGEYAWKPIIIAQMIIEAEGVVAWMDAGNLITGKLSRLQGCALRHGIFSQPSSGDLLEWTHPLTLSYFEKDAEWALGKKNINGACIAIDTASFIAKKIVFDWAHFAKIKEVIAPVGSDRSNHRQDQALLSVLLNIANFKTNKRNQRSLNFEIHKDVD